MSLCIYNAGWGGKCKSDATKGNFCLAHIEIKCGCGNQAVKECCKSAMGNFTCFNPVCDECDKTYTAPYLNDQNVLVSGKCKSCK